MSSDSKTTEAVSRFRHVSNRLLRELLSKPAAQTSMEDVRGAVTTTILSLGLDAVRDDVAEPAFEARRAAARDAVRSRRKADKLAALQRFWLS